MRRYGIYVHFSRMPGKPDLVFPSRKKVIFVHGCFWHLHPGCREGRPPGSNTGYWTPKLKRNVERDAEVQTALRAGGWETVVIWECQTADVEQLRCLLHSLLRP